MSSAKKPNPWVIRGMSGFTVTVVKALGKPPEEILLRFNKAQLMLLRTALDQLVPPVPAEPAPDKSELH